MPHVISASRRTDIPAFYADWFVNRIKEGRVMVRQPYSGRPLAVSLEAGDVSAIVFWSKNHAPLLPHLDTIERTTENLYFHFTITGNENLELHVPHWREAVRDYCFLADRYSPRRVMWRFDPISITDKLSYEVHEERFVSIAELLKGRTDSCIISFAHPYKKVLSNMAKYTEHTLVELSLAKKQEYVKRLAKKAGQYGIRLLACCNDELLSDDLGKARCIDGGLLSELSGAPIDTRLASTRKECACTKSIDIGAYDTCGHGCTATRIRIKKGPKRLFCGTIHLRMHSGSRWRNRDLIWCSRGYFQTPDRKSKSIFSKRRRVRREKQESKKDIMISI